MQTFAQRRQRAIFAEKKGQVIIQILGIVRARRYDKHRAPLFGGDERQDKSPRAALEALHTLRSGPLTSQKTAELIFEKRRAHEKKPDRCREIFGTEDGGGALAACSACFDQVSIAAVVSLTRTCKKSGW